MALPIFHANASCVIDSSTCAQWIASGKIDSTACVSMENGKCHMNSKACMGAMSSGSCDKKMDGNSSQPCSKECMEACKSKGINCASMECPEKKSACCKK